MKHILFLLTLIVPSVALAQQPGVTPLPNIAPILQIIDLENALQGSINMHGFTLIKSAKLYRNLADTIKDKPALRLSAGNNIIIQKQIGHWIKVVRGNKAATNFTRDTSSYYIPSSAREGTRTFVLL